MLLGLHETTVGGTSALGVWQSEEEEEAEEEKRSVDSQPSFHNVLIRTNPTLQPNAGPHERLQGR